MTSRGKIRSVRKPAINKTTDDFEPCWNLLEQALIDIHTRNAGKLSFEQLYRASYKIVLRKQGSQLYEKVRTFEENWFKTQIVPGIVQLIPPNLASAVLVSAGPNERRQVGESILRGLRDIWNNHNLAMNMAADILMYLDRTYTVESKVPTLFATTIDLYRSIILNHDLDVPHADLDRNVCIFDFLIAVVIGLIDMERDGDVIDKALVRQTTSMLEELYETEEEVNDQKLYLTVFEPQYLTASRKFYAAEVGKVLRDTDAGTWLRHTRRRLQEEADRCRTTVSLSTTSRIAKVVEEELITKHLDDFLAMEATGLKSMIDNDRYEDLAILFELISRVDPSRKALKAGLQQRVLHLGAEIEKDLKNTDFSAAATATEEQPAKNGEEKAKAAPLTVSALATASAVKWVDDVLRLKDKFDAFWEKCFEKDLVIQSAVTKAFSDFINGFDRGAEFVSLFIDNNLKQGIKGMTEAEIDVVLEKAIVLVQYLSERDLFERYYQKHLAKRLLHGKSENEQVEQDMIRRMKDKMGVAFTSKFEGMFKDMQISADLTRGYREYINSQGEVDKSRIDLGIQVLTSNSWPPEVMGRPIDGVRAECNFPPALKRMQDSFLKYYLSDRSGRKLTWVGSGGTAEVRCHFPKISGKESGPLSRERRYDLTVSTYGMIVLLLFNDLAESEGLSLAEIQETTNIPQADLIRTLMGLAIHPKARVLVKDPATKSIKDGDKFFYNPQFASKVLKIKVPVVSAVSRVEGDEERKRTTENNDQTRAYLIDAAIVRIMKSRKRLPHSQLVTEVITQLTSLFKPEVPKIKRRIEDLINREYLLRLEDSAEYEYVA